MDTDTYKVDISFDLKPYWKQTPPVTEIRLDTDLIWHGHLEDIRRFEFTRYLQKGDHRLEIEMSDKPELDSDQGLALSNLRFGRICDKLFVWQGVYRPTYPEPWATEQKDKGYELPPEIRNTDYLGWNGTWSLMFSCPVFTWIHRVQNLGWIYD